VKVDVTVSEIHIDVKRPLSGKSWQKLGLFAATEWHRLYHKYVPFRTGVLAGQVGYEGRPGKVNFQPWQIEHTAPYAHRQYHGHFNFRKDLHPRASRMWDKAAEPTEKPKLVQSLQRFIDSGKISLN